MTSGHNYSIDYWYCKGSVNHVLAWAKVCACDVALLPRQQEHALPVVCPWRRPKLSEWRVNVRMACCRRPRPPCALRTMIPRRALAHHRERLPTPTRSSRRRRRRLNATAWSGRQRGDRRGRAATAPQRRLSDGEGADKPCTFCFSTAARGQVRLLRVQCSQSEHVRQRQQQQSFRRRDSRLFFSEFRAKRLSDGRHIGGLSNKHFKPRYSQHQRAQRRDRSVSR